MIKYGIMFLSMSVSGALAILFVAVLQLFVKKRAYQFTLYYLWLIPVFRGLIPLSGSYSLMNQLLRSLVLPERVVLPEGVFGTPGAQVEIGANVTAAVPLNSPLVNGIFAVWLTVALVLMVKKIVAVQSFSHYVRAGWKPVEQPKTLNMLHSICEALNIRRPVELYVNPLIASPLLLGVFKPVIVLPVSALDSEAMNHVLHHELMHCKRHDMLYIWLVQLTACLHWFNPAYHWLCQKVAGARELACDEAVLTMLGAQHSKAYGTTLIESFYWSGRYEEKHAAVPLLENKQLLQQRLESIASPKPKRVWAAGLGVVLFLLVVTFAVVCGVYTASPQVNEVKQSVHKQGVVPLPRKELHFHPN